MSAQHPHPHGDLHNPDTAHEALDINMRAIVSFAILLTVVTVGIQGAMVGLFHIFDRMETGSDRVVSPLAPAAGQVPPDPRLQTTPWADLATLRASELAFLQSYGWVDQQAGVARIPIDRAKGLLLQKGLPVREVPVDPTVGTSIAATGEASGGRNLPARAAGASEAPVPQKPGGGS